jgi:4'-phosphopantetheinyl transferase
VPWGSGHSDVPLRGLPPAHGECHVWPVRVTGETGWLGWLDPAERERAHSIRSAHGRDTFIVSRAAQRLVLSRYVDRDPDALVIQRLCAHCGSPDHGRPAVASGSPDYSVSHSGEWVVLAVVGSGRVGLDIEHGRPLADVVPLANRTLTAAERAEFEAVPDASRSAWFYRVWTRKEAVLKATGQGLDGDFGRVDVRASVVAVAPMDSVPGALLHLQDLPAPDTYMAALASTDPVRAVRVCQLVRPDHS